MQNKLSNEFFTNFHPGTEREEVNSFRNVLDSGMYIMFHSFKMDESRQKDVMIRDMMILFQMTISKGVAIMQLYNGLSHQNSFDQQISYLELKDPTTLSILTRNQFESFCTFNNILIKSQNEEIKKILYKIWVISGHKYRQQFIREGMPQSLLKKAQDEEVRIASLIQEIRETNTYLSLRNRDSLENLIRKKEFKFVYKGNKFVKQSWKELFLNADVIEVFKNIYAEMSLKVHPSNVSVFQYAQIFETKENIQSCRFMLKLSKFLLAFFISDYCNSFKSGKEAFLKLPIETQILIDRFNVGFRNSSYSIMDLNQDEELAIDLQIGKFVKENSTKDEADY